ncbi:MAG: MarR family transcriptional regulator [Planctomycetes bacterium]|nr:MarR family transcriptional regulator [Planctomycetota bacterium]MCH9723302.1 MarR family transcriptional regulator [Planctomycetota bacterium]MCH9779123.1 MarR family transcriptional regulator [Planctomycetota bacterium]MCH9792567.1 MarR family transcriptional regulator [Planctomycetota bacterium]MDF1744899.1 MarR family transcriptional regulator [Gimesia sp.]
MPHSNLQQEIRKKQPFDSLEQEAILNILRTSDIFHNQFGRLFREFGVTPSQYNVLRILRGEGKPMPSLEIADRMVQVVPAITGLIDRLQAQDFVKRKRCTEDRRVVFIEITAKALALLNQMDEPELNLHQKLIGHLSAEELSDLSRLLEKARTSLTTDN